MIHRPVLLNEVLEYLNPKPGRNYVDATADGGGHSAAILKRIVPSGKLLCLEWDEELYTILNTELKRSCPGCSKNYILRRANFARLREIVRRAHFRPVSGVLFDLGLSSFHIEASRRGFSFQRPEALDMRFSADLRDTAADILNRRSVPDIETILRTFGEERFARRIARKIGELRSRHPLRFTTDLVALVRSATPPWYHRSRIHFATKTFQALRIAVNHELENLASGLRAATAVLAPGGILITIAFHSLEDRTIKRFSKDEANRGRLIPVVKKPITPGADEIRMNPRARSAKMRVFERTRTT